MAIACMGLLGLTALAVARRTREIGIRKALGATVHGPLVVLTSEFAWLVVLGNAAALPPAIQPRRVHIAEGVSCGTRPSVSQQRSRRSFGQHHLPSRFVPPCLQLT